MDVALKYMELKAVYSTYILALQNVFTGYMGSLTKDIINNMMAKYIKHHFSLQYKKWTFMKR